MVDEKKINEIRQRLEKRKSDVREDYGVKGMKWGEHKQGQTTGESSANNKVAQQTYGALSNMFDPAVMKVAMRRYGISDAAAKALKTGQSLPEKEQKETASALLDIALSRDLIDQEGAMRIAKRAGMSMSDFNSLGFDVDDDWWNEVD